MENYEEIKEKQVEQLTQNIKGIYADAKDIDSFIRAVAETIFDLTKDNFKLLEVIVLALDAEKISPEDLNEETANIIAGAVDFFGKQE